MTWPTTRTSRPRASPPTWKRCLTCRCKFRRCLDRRVGEAIDIYVNNRLVARGEVVLVEDKLGVTMTEIIKAERS